MASNKGEPRQSKPREKAISAVRLMLALGLICRPWRLQLKDIDFAAKGKLAETDEAELLNAAKFFSGERASICTA
jgi:hypothetical protein